MKCSVKDYVYRHTNKLNMGVVRITSNYTYFHIKIVCLTVDKYWDIV